MKLTFVIFVLLPLAALALPSTDEETSSERIKRSGGLSFLQTIQKSLFGASAQLSTSSSGSSSSSGHDFPDSPHDTKGFDGWQLKKSILNTLFQAVKAITGGVTTLGGQLIKGSGYAVSAKGKLIQASGDAVSGAGQKIINSAHLIPANGHAGYGHSAGGGSAAFFAKLSGASGSAIAGLSSGSSGTSSGTTHDSHESFTSYGGPSGSGISYTAPGSVSYSEIKTNDYIVSSKPSYTPIKTYDIPKSPSTSYGPAFEDYHYSRHPEDASIVLQEILKTLPEKPSKTIKSQYHNVKQYEIPSDPIPPFRPLKTHSAHSVYGVPAETTVSHTHTLTTSYGSPAVDQYHKYFEHRSDGSEPIPSVVSKYRDTDNSHSIWHKMTLKKTKPITTNDTKVTTSNDLTKTFDDSLSQNELHKTLVGQALGKNTDFTIEKSIQYEIKESDYKKP